MAGIHESILHKETKNLLLNLLMDQCAFRNFFFKKACTEMVMPVSCSNQTMFPPFGSDDNKADRESCLEGYDVKPRPHWITTEFGGQVSFIHSHFFSR